MTSEDRDAKSIKKSPANSASMRTFLEARDVEELQVGLLHGDALAAPLSVQRLRE